MAGGDPVSWLVIERGWKVASADGSEVGTIEETVGDSGKDIFNGLVISTGLLKPALYVPAEEVTAITEGRVELALAADEVPRLERWSGTPPSAEIRAD